MLVRDMPVCQLKQMLQQSLGNCRDSTYTQSQEDSMAPCTALEHLHAASTVHKKELEWIESLSRSGDLSAEAAEAERRRADQKFEEAKLAFKKKREGGENQAQRGLRQRRKWSDTGAPVKTLSSQGLGALGTETDDRDLAECSLHLKLSAADSYYTQPPWSDLPLGLDESPPSSVVSQIRYRPTPAPGDEP